MNSDTKSPVSCTRDARGVATVTLERPEKHNAFDDGMIRILREHFEQLADDASVRVVVLAAQGKSFSAGGDLAWMQRMADYDYAANLADAPEHVLRQLLAVDVTGAANMYHVGNICAE